MFKSFGETSESANVKGLPLLSTFNQGFGIIACGGKEGILKCADLELTLIGAVEDDGMSSVVVTVSLADMASSKLDSEETRSMLYNCTEKSLASFLPVGASSSYTQMSLFREFTHFLHHGRFASHL